MARMLMRAFFLSVAVMAVAAPGASATIADHFMPTYDASDGVNVRMGKHSVQATFGPQAGTLYERFAGKLVRVGCGRAGAEQGGSSFAPDSGDMELRGSGYLSTDMRFPRKRGRVDLHFVGKPYDVCFAATKRRSEDCLSVSEFATDLCVRMVVALTDAGRTMIDERSRLLELDELAFAPFDEARKAFGDDVVALDSPDASPQIGKVGLYNAPDHAATVVVTAAGRRMFVRKDGGVYSTNVSDVFGGHITFSLM
jgi:hypothetical protein